MTDARELLTKLCDELDTGDPYRAEIPMLVNKARAYLAAVPAPPAEPPREPTKRWPFARKPGDVARDVLAAFEYFEPAMPRVDAMLAALRYRLIEHDEPLAPAAEPVAQRRPRELLAEIQLARQEGREAGWQHGLEQGWKQGRANALEEIETERAAKAAAAEPVAQPAPQAADYFGTPPPGGEPVAQPELTRKRITYCGRCDAEREYDSQGKCVACRKYVVIPAPNVAGAISDNARKGAHSDDLIAEAKRDWLSAPYIWAHGSFIARLVARIESDAERIRTLEAEIERLRDVVYVVRQDALCRETASRERERTQRELLRECLSTLAHAHVFICSREKMHPDGVALYAETLRAVQDYFLDRQGNATPDSAASPTGGENDR